MPKGSTEGKGEPNCFSSNDVIGRESGRSPENFNKKLAKEATLNDIPLWVRHMGRWRGKKKQIRPRGKR